MDLLFAGSVIFTGLAIVFVALGGLTAVIWAMGKVFSAYEAKKNTSAPPAPLAKPVAPVIMTAQPVQPEIEDGIEEEIVAVISAAIYSMTGTDDVIIKSVKRIKEARPAWSMAGVMQNTNPF